MRKPLLSILFCLPFVSGCAALAVGAAGAVVVNETHDNNIYVGQLPSSSAQTWAQTKVTLSNLSLKPIVVDNEAMSAVAEIDDAKVTVSVSAYDFHKSEIRVEARKYMLNNGQIAKMVFDKIVADLGNQR